MHHGAEFLRHSRDAHAFGGDDGPVPHVVFWYLYDNRENLLPGRVRDWDRDGLGPKIIYNLHVTLDWLQKLDGRRREDVVAESDRRVDDARVGGHRLGRWRRLIHDDTTGISGGGVRGLVADFYLELGKSKSMLIFPLFSTLF